VSIKKPFFALIALTFGTPAIAAEPWVCDVQKFNSFSGDKAFERKNKAKTFEITQKGKKVTVTALSDHFNDNTRVYTVFTSGSHDNHAMYKSRVSYGLISLPKKPEKKLAAEGYFSAVVTVHSSIYNNTWLLRCK
jgi:hypothetical protein